MSQIQTTLNNLREGFFAFRVQKWRVSFIVILLIISIGIMSIYSIPKESTPEIDFWIIVVGTVYKWSWPVDIDQQITEEIENGIKDIDWINKITSNSVFGYSQIIIELKNWVDANDTVVEIESQIDKISLPSDAEDPKVENITADNQDVFKILVYWDEDLYSDAYIKTKMLTLQKNLEWVSDIDNIYIDSNSSFGQPWSDSSTENQLYEAKILVNKSKADEYWINLLTISQAIESWNNNQPLWNHTVWDNTYSFRIKWELETLEDLEKVPLNIQWSVVYLGDIATIKKDLINNSIKKSWWYNDYWYNYVKVAITKKESSNILTAAKTATQLVAQEFENPEYLWLQYEIIDNMADYVSDDFQKLRDNWVTTLLIIITLLFIFIGLKESLIAAFGIILSFCITFFMLNSMGLSMNFLTNFSLIICFWIAVDTTLVIIEWAHEKQRLWFNPKNAILLAVKEFKRPLIAGTATTLSAFLPLMLLPWIMWKFFAYIPITIFSTLIATLVIAFTLNSAVYYFFSKKLKYYEPELWNKDLMTPENRALLQHDRKWKIEKQKEQSNKEKKTFRHRVEKIMDKFSRKYSEFLDKILDNSLSRFLGIFVPIILLVLTFIFLSPKIWVSLFPSSYYWIINLHIEDTAGTTTEKMSEYSIWLDKLFSSYEEIDNRSFQINDNKITWTINLVNDNKEDILFIESDLNKKADYLRLLWLEVTIETIKDGPPQDSSIWIVLTTDDNSNYDKLFLVAKDFKDYLKTLEGSKNVSISSEESPGEFIFEMDPNKLVLLWLNPYSFYNTLYINANGIQAGTVKETISQDKVDIQVLYKEYEDQISPDQFNSMTIDTPKWKIALGDVSEYYIKSATTQISRENWDITIRVWWDFYEWYTPAEIQSKLLAFADSYDFPEWVWYKSWWEAQENQELINGMVIAFIVAISIIFIILVLQFNSYLRPIMIMFTILIALIWVNFWLRITWTNYSIMFGIGFVALAWIVINDAIVFLDRADTNKQRWADKKHALTEAWKTRLQPIFLTTITTIFWMLTIVSDPLRRPLAITIIFGLFVGSSSTLLSVPALYIDMPKIRHLIRRIIYSLWIFLWAFVGFILILAILGSILSKNIIASLSANPMWFGILFLLFFIAYIIISAKLVNKNGYSISSKRLKLKYLKQTKNSKDKQEITTWKFILRYLLILGLFISPIVISGIVSWIASIFATSPAFIATLSSTISMLCYLALIMKELHTFWISENNEFWHDKIIWTIIIDEKIEEDEMQDDLEQI